MERADAERPDRGRRWIRRWRRRIRLRRWRWWRTRWGRRVRRQRRRKGRLEGPVGRPTEATRRFAVGVVLDGDVVGGTAYVWSEQHETLVPEAIKAVASLRARPGTGAGRVVVMDDQEPRPSVVFVI